MRVVYDDYLCLYELLISQAVQHQSNVVDKSLSHSVDMLTTIFRLLEPMGGGSRLGLFRSLLTFTAISDMVDRELRRLLPM